MDYFWKASIDELKQGYYFNEYTRTYDCLICDKSFEVGMIYEMECGLCEAQKAVEAHIKDEHKSMFNYLLEMGKSYTGLTDHQKEIMKMFYEDLSDKEIALKAGVTTSTIRNQRFSFREKYKQAKITIAMMELIEERKNNKMNDEERLVDIHRTATMIDERYAISQDEKSDVLSRYFDENNKLIIKEFPVKEKRKIIILQHLTEEFNKNKKYSEKEVNSILKNFYDDIATVRRYLIEYGFLDRTKDGREYWVKMC
ncbi:MAG: DUF2087 domain-containing protein [Oscillospiraceae bacterium]|nr:DUF2087 domain-containing protein [Oscillospiraceae bacterium]